jgi:hypothetical protein
MKPIFVTLLCLSFLSAANAQTAKRAERHNVFNVPCHGVTSLPFSREKSSVKTLEPLGIDGAEVHLTSHKFADEQIVFLEACDPNVERSIVEDESGRHASVVRGYISYETKGRIFAYRFTCYAIMTKDGFITERFGAAGDVYYVDDNGDCTFDRYRGAMPLRFLPGWLKTR